MAREWQNAQCRRYWVLMTPEGIASASARCFKCGRELPLGEMRAGANLATKPHPHWEKVPWCPECFREQAPLAGEDLGGRLKWGLPILALNLVLLWRGSSRLGPAFPIGLLIALVAIPVSLMVWRIRHALRPENPYALDHRGGFPSNWKTRQLSGPMQWVWVIGLTALLTRVGPVHGVARALMAGIPRPDWTSICA